MIGIAVCSMLLVFGREMGESVCYWVLNGSGFS